MNQVIEKDDVIATIAEFLDCNSGDESTERIIMSIGCELLCVSDDKMLELISEHCMHHADDEYDYCYECTGYGDDYSVDDNGELVCNCDDCSLNPRNQDDDE